MLNYSIFTNYVSFSFCRFFVFNFWFSLLQLEMQQLMNHASKYIYMYICQTKCIAAL